MYFCISEDASQKSWDFWSMWALHLPLGGRVQNGLPRWLSGKESACQCRSHRKCSFNPLVGKIPWRRKWQSTPVVLPGKSHGQRSLAEYSTYGLKELDMTEKGLVWDRQANAWNLLKWNWYYNAMAQWAAGLRMWPNWYSGSVSQLHSLCVYPGLTAPRRGENVALAESKITARLSLVSCLCLMINIYDFGEKNFPCL